MASKKSWTSSIPENVGKVAGILKEIRDAVNACLGGVRALSGIKGTGGVEVKVSDSNIVIDASILRDSIASISGTRVYAQTLSVSGLLPTYAEMQTMLSGFYGSTNTPKEGDLIYIYDPVPAVDVLKFRCQVKTSATAIPGGWNSIWHVAFTVSGVTYYAIVDQLGLY